MPKKAKAKRGKLRVNKKPVCFKCDARCRECQQRKACADVFCEGCVHSEECYGTHSYTEGLKALDTVIVIDEVNLFRAPHFLNMDDDDVEEEDYGDDEEW